MSYILEAIKKADRKRKIGEVPDLHADHTISGEEPSKRASWPYLVALLLFFNAGGLFWWLEPWKESEPKEVQVESSVLEETSVPMESSLVGMSGDEDIITASEVVAEGQVAEKMGLGVNDQLKPENKEAAVEKEKGAVLTPPDLDQQVPPPAPQSSGAEQVAVMPEEAKGMGNKEEGEGASSEKALANSEKIFAEGEANFEDTPADISEETDVFDETETSDNATEQKITFEIFDISKVPYIYQLPTSIQQELPEVTISFHSYTHRPATRMVRINGRIMREGQDLTKEIKLEKIVPSGVVLLLEKRQFRVDVNTR